MPQEEDSLFKDEILESIPPERKGETPLDKITSNTYAWCFLCCTDLRESNRDLHKHLGHETRFYNSWQEMKSSIEKLNKIYLDTISKEK